MSHMTRAKDLVVLFAMVASAGLAFQPSGPPADLILFGRVYTLAWPEPSPDGTPSAAAPFADGVWHPDAEAIRDGRIAFTGAAVTARTLAGPRTRTITVPAGAAILPGMVDAHVHAFELGASLERVNLVGVETEAAVVDRIVARARTTPRGEWIVGWGWDEGAWANRCELRPLGL